MIPARTPRETPDVAAVFREVHGQAVSTLVRIFGDISLAEDAVQDAFVVACDRWVTNGVPPNPAGWIVTTARNRATTICGVPRAAARSMTSSAGAQLGRWVRVTSSRRTGR